MAEQSSFQLFRTHCPSKPMNGNDWFEEWWIRHTRTHTCIIVLRWQSSWSDNGDDEESKEEENDDEHDDENKEESENTCETI